MYQKILVPLDGSELAEQALPHARAIAECAGSEIILLRVATNPALEFAFSDPAIAETAIESMQEDATRYMARQLGKLREAGFKATSLLRQGAVAETILAVAEEIGADLIAMSTHGRTGPARWLMGSVADRVVRSSPVPVMVIRPRQPG